MTLNKRLDLIEPKLCDRNFRTGRGTANEVNFWIFDYQPEDEMAVRDYVDFLTARINDRSVFSPAAKTADGSPASSGNTEYDLRIKHFDIFDLILDVLREKKYLDRVIKMEKAKGSSAIINPLKVTLRLTEEEDLIIKKIVETIEPQRDVIFLTGVGKAWPIIRSHTILNNLHDKVENNPLVMFFPGEYIFHKDCCELRLLGDISDGNYYRAFKLV